MKMVENLGLGIALIAIGIIIVHWTWREHKALIARTKAWRNKKEVEND